MREIERRLQRIEAAVAPAPVEPAFHSTRIIIDPRDFRCIEDIEPWFEAEREAWRAKLIASGEAQETDGAFDRHSLSAGF